MILESLCSGVGLARTQRLEELAVFFRGTLHLRERIHAFVNVKRQFVFDSLVDRDQPWILGGSVAIRISEGGDPET